MIYLAKIIGLTILLFQFCNKNIAESVKISKKISKSNLESHSFKNTMSLNSAQSFVSPDSIDFSFVVFDKYMIIAPDISTDVIGKNHKKLKTDLGFAFLCDVNESKIDDEYKNFIGREFSIINSNGKVRNLKIVALKIIMQETPHFGTIQEAQSTNNFEKAIFEKMLENAKLYLVGEISEADKSFEFARSTNLKQYEPYILNENIEVTEDSKKIIAKNLNFSIDEMTISVVFSNEKETYYEVTTTRKSEMCGQDSEYEGCEIVKINIDGEFEKIYDANANEMIDVLDLNSDGIPEFIYYDGFEDDYYLLDLSGKVDVNFLEFSKPNFDCPC